MLDILSTLSHLSDIGDWPEKLEYEMTELSEEAADRGKRRRIEVADETLTYRNVLIDDLTPTGAQLAAAAGFKPKQHAVVLQVLANGELEDIRPSETVDLKRADGQFVIVETDRLLHHDRRSALPVAVPHRLGRYRSQARQAACWRRGVPRAG